MKGTWLRILGLLVFVGLLAVGGCGKGKKPPAPMPVVKADVPLPEWAPKNPSPEFLRAAQVLKPLPAEALSQYEPTMAGEAWRIAFRRTLPALYEFFGTLTDEQLKRLLSAKEIRIPMKSLAEEQRAALDRWFDVWRDEMQKIPSEAETADRRVNLYRSGVKEDFSNAYVGFVIENHVINIKFWGIMPDGSVQGGSGVTFATI